MQLILHEDHPALDASKPPGEQETIIPKGCHEAERIQNPLGHEGDWLVQAGTRVGKTEEEWRSWVQTHFHDSVRLGDMAVIIKE